jgi:hypothetical protein
VKESENEFVPWKLLTQKTNGTIKNTLPSQWFLVPARLYAYQPLLQLAQIPDVSSKEGAVISAVLSTRKFHRGHH